MSRPSANTLFEATDLYQANLDAAYDSSIDIVVNQGGTSSGKTYSIMQVLCTLAIREPKSVITVVGQDIPNLKVGALRDQQNIVSSSPRLQELIRAYNKSERIYDFHNGSLLEFKSYDDFQDAKSGKRDFLFVNEANFNGAETQFTELSMRTRKKIFLDYNPNAEFWVHTKLLHQGNVRRIISDHRHNTFLDQKMHDKIEGNEDPELWRVYARGLTGKIEGLIFRNWQEVQSVPPTANFIGTGIDFGFTNDPTAAVDVWMSDGGLYLDERVYEHGLTNPDLNSRMAETGGVKRRRHIADSADPRSIRELENLGWMIEGAEKGPDSVVNSIDILKRYPLFVTKRSYNLKKELNSYKWRVDKKSGLAVNEPVDFLNHAIDAVRYVASNCLGHRQTTGKYSYM